MKKVNLLYNPYCSKSREALKLLQEAGCEVELREYLKNTPTKKELRDMLMKLGKKAHDLIRKKEALYKTNFEGKKFSEQEWLQVLYENPQLLERPILISGYRAAIGRTPEAIEEFLR